jgi:hypothetical protein
VVRKALFGEVEGEERFAPVYTYRLSPFLFLVLKQVS